MSEGTIHLKTDVYITACGKTLKDLIDSGVKENRATSDYTKVTCANCIRTDRYEYLEKNKIR